MANDLKDSESLRRLQGMHIESPSAVSELLAVARVNDLATKKQEYTEKMHASTVRGVLKGVIGAALVVAGAAALVSAAGVLGYAIGAAFLGLGAVNGYEAIQDFSMRSRYQAALTGVQTSAYRFADDLVVNKGVDVIAELQGKENPARRADGKQWTQVASEKSAYKENTITL